MNDSHAKKAFQNDRQTADENVDRKVVVPVIQEELEVEKEVVETGKVRVSKKIGEYETLIDEPLLREEVAIERVHKNEYVDSAPQPRQENDVLVIPVVREEIIVQKRLVLVEELRVRKQVIEEHKPQKVTLLKEEVEVERIPADEDSGGEKR